MKSWAIIFDLDGVLLELTRAEEELFFQPFAKRIDAAALSRDWNTYAIRNDEDIVKEIVARYGLPAGEARVMTGEYLALLEKALASGSLRSLPLPGAAALLNEFSARATLGLATANFRRAAELRLQQAGLWHHVCALAHGADGGGHKSQILARAISASGLANERIIFIGDNLNDMRAGQDNGVHFIAFSTDPARRETFRQAGVHHITATHDRTAEIIYALMASGT